jgi:peptide/nickel transport system permease protein
MTALSPEIGGLAVTPPASEAPRFFRRLLRRKLAVVCLLYLAVVIGVAIVAPIVLPKVAGQHTGNLLEALQGPSGKHLLGVDSLGRDVLQRLLVGTRITMIGVAETLIVGLAIGVPVGLAAGFLGGALDKTVSWLADLMFSVPAIIVILVVLSVFPHSMTAAMVTFGVIAAPGLMRVVRSVTLSVREEPYIAAAQVAGLSPGYIITRHVAPRVASPVIVQASLLAAVAMTVQTGLSFLGLVVAAPAPSWGGMVADGFGVILQQPWLIWPPGIAIALTILALGLLGDAVRDATTEAWSTPTHSGGRRRRRVSTTNTGSRADQPAVAPVSDALLSVQGLNVTFKSSGHEVRAVEGVSFDIEAGATVGIVGESGCGKTATVMSILGLLPGAGEIESGRILFDGRDLAHLSERELRGIRGKQIGLISQEPMISLNPVFRVGWQLAEVVQRHHGVSRSVARARVLELLEQVRLPDPAAVARRYPHELSGGMAQRVAIARALAGEPKLLIADEPTTALDVTVQAEILDLLRELQRDRQMAILLVTHDWGVVADICERAIVMYAGQVVERADSLQMVRDPRHPYTEGLLASNPHNAPEGEVLPSIPGMVPRPGQWPVGCHFQARCVYATAACGEHPIELEKLAGGRETRCIHHDALEKVG